MKKRSCRNCGWASEEEDGGRYYLRCMDPAHRSPGHIYPCERHTDGQVSPPGDNDNPRGIA